MSPTVRAPGAEDAEGIVALLAELGYASTAARMRTLLRAQREPGLLLASGDGALLGLVAFADGYYFPTDSVVCRITALVVPPAARRRGVARMLVESVVRGARARCCSAVEVTTALSRADAHAFYESAGFERTSYRYHRRL